MYLAPPNYHRVHIPIAGSLTRTTYVPGERFSVSLLAASAIKRLFCRNERVICWFDTLAGEMAIVLVGALNVSSISTAKLGEIPSGAERRWREATPVPYARGAEIGRFNLGSTVIVLFPAGRCALARGARSHRAAQDGRADRAPGDDGRVMSYAAAGTPNVLRLRAEIFARIRSFFAARGVLEVDTPALSSAGAPDLALSSVTASLRSVGARASLPAHVPRVCDEASARRGQRGHLPNLPSVSRRRARPLA